MNTHHITRRDGRWEVWYSGSEGRQLAARSPFSITDAWQKCLDWHGRKAAEAYRKMQEWDAGEWQAPCWCDDDIEDHPEKCLCDRCVIVIRGECYYRDGKTPVPGPVDEQA